MWHNLLILIMHFNSFWYLYRGNSHCQNSVFQYFHHSKRNYSHQQWEFANSPLPPKPSLSLCISLLCILYINKILQFCWVTIFLNFMVTQSYFLPLKLMPRSEGKNGGKENLNTAVGMWTAAATWETVWKCLKKTKNRTPLCDPVILLLGIS